MIICIYLSFLSSTHQVTIATENITVKKNLRSGWYLVMSVRLSLYVFVWVHKLYIHVIMHLHTVLLPCVCVSGFDKFIWRTIGPKSIVHFSHDYIVTNSINILLIGSKSIPNGTHTNPWLSQFGSCFKTYQKLWCVCMCVHMCVCSTVHNVLCASVCT